MTDAEARAVVRALVARLEVERDGLEATLRNIMEVAENDVACRLANEAIEKWGRNE